MEVESWDDRESNSLELSSVVMLGDRLFRNLSLFKLPSIPICWNIVCRDLDSDFSGREAVEPIFLYNDDIFI